MNNDDERDYAEEAANRALLEERDESEPLARIVFDDSSIGCVFDGAQGWHNTYRLIDLAVGNGMELDCCDTAALEAYRHAVATEDHFGWIVDQGGLSDKALEHLQSLTAPGLYWSWDDGLFIVPGCQEAEEPLSAAECEHCERGQFS